MKNPQTIFHKDGVWIADKAFTAEAIRQTSLALKKAEANLDSFGKRGMGVMPDVKAYRKIAVKLWELQTDLREYHLALLEMDIRDGIPDPRETSSPIPEIAD